MIHVSPNYPQYTQQPNQYGGLGFVTSISTLIVTFLAQQYNLSIQQSTALVGVLPMIFLALDSNSINFGDLFTLTNVLLVAVCYMVYIYRETIKDYFNRDNKMWSVNISKHFDINNFTMYIKYHPEYFDKPKENNIGDVEFYIQSKRFRNINNHFTCGNLADLEEDLHRSKYDEMVKFNDKDYGVAGHYVWRFKNIDASEKDKPCQLNHPYITIYINKPSVNEYLEYMRKKVDEKVRSDDFVQMYYRVIDDTGQTFKFPGVLEKREPIEVLEKRYIKTLFHPKRDELWQTLKLIDRNPSLFKDCGQTPHLSLCLYGPPGTGKSSFAQRVASALQRHMVTVNLSIFKKSKYAYNIMRYVNGYKPHQLVYILDEFDLTVRELVNKKKQTNAMMKYYMGKAAERYHKYESDTEDEDEAEKKKGKKKKKTCLQDYGYDAEDFCLEDLLEIIQGPVAIDGQIIIATTNNFEEIYSYLPALFRHGRLMPVKFDYMDGATLNEVSEHFFGRTFMLNVTVKDKLPPAFVLMVATDAKVKDLGFDWFVVQITKKLEANRKKRLNSSDDSIDSEDADGVKVEEVY